jgi:hypothetical protein
MQEVIMRPTGLVALLALMLAQSDAIAAPVWSPSTVTVARVDVEDTGVGGSKIFLVFSAAPHNTNCGNPATGYWQAGGSAENVKNILAVALSARLSGRPVKVLWNNQTDATPNPPGSVACSAGGSGANSGYPVVRGLELL